MSCIAADDLSTHQTGDEVSVTGLNSILPKEHGNKFYNLPIIRHLEKDVCAVAAWDSSIHDSIYLNRVTEGRILDCVLNQLMNVKLLCSLEPQWSSNEFVV